MPVLSWMNKPALKFYTTSLPNSVIIDEQFKDAVDRQCIAHRYSIESIEAGIARLTALGIKESYILVTLHDESGAPLKTIKANKNWKTLFK